MSAKPQIKKGEGEEGHGKFHAYIVCNTPLQSDAGAYQQCIEQRRRTKEEEGLPIEHTVIYRLENQYADLEQKVTFKRLEDTVNPAIQYTKTLKNLTRKVVNHERGQGIEIKPNHPVPPFHELPGKELDRGLNKEATIKLNVGPTKGDGPAKLYMYKLKDFKPVKDHATRMYKIGKAISPEERVPPQGRENKEKYEIVYEIDALFALLSEQVVFKQLKAFHTPRPELKVSKKEWYTGTKYHFIETIKMVVDLVTNRYRDKFMLDNFCLLFSNTARVVQIIRDKKPPD